MEQICWFQLLMDVAEFIIGLSQRDVSWQKCNPAAARSAMCGKRDMSDSHCLA